MAKLVSRTYGEALFEIAMEADKTQELMDEIQAVQDVLIRQKELDKFLKHPGIPKQEKVQVMENVFKGRVSDELTGFLKLVVTKERYGDLQAVFQYFMDRVKEQRRIGTAYVTTAIQLTNVQKAEIQSKLLQTTAYETMEMHYSVDSSLIGGMVIRINDRVVDSSIRTKLNDLTKQLLNIQLG